MRRIHPAFVFILLIQFLGMPAFAVQNASVEVMMTISSTRSAPIFISTDEKTDVTWDQDDVSISVTSAEGLSVERLHVNDKGVIVLPEHELNQDTIEISVY